MDSLRTYLERTTSGSYWRGILVVLSISALPALATAQDEGASGETSEDEPVRLTPPDESEASEEETEQETAGTVGSDASTPQQTEGGDDEPVEIPEIEVIGRSEKDVESVPGSADRKSVV